MDELSTVLLDKLIEKTLEGMSTEEKLNFIERIFADLDPEGKERFLRRMVQGLSGDGAAEALVSEGASGAQMPRGWPPFGAFGESGPPMMRRGVRSDLLHEFGPWQRCCRMMMAVSQAPRAEAVDMAEPARIFSALSNETRLKIVKLLSEGEMRVDDLIPTLGLAQSTVSHHLKVLENAGLLRSEKRGRCVYYSIAPTEGR